MQRKRKFSLDISRFGAGDWIAWYNVSVLRSQLPGFQDGQEWTSRLGNSKVNLARYGDSKRRLGLTLIRAILGVLLLSNVNFRATYRDVQNFPLLQAGLTAMNTSLVNDPNFQYFATGNFWWHFPSMMSYAYPVTPLSCSDLSSDCQAFYFPGQLSLIQFPAGEPAVTKTDSPSATTLIEKDAPGYQIEFEAIDSVPNFNLADCRVFGIPIVAVQVCLKETNDSFIAGTLPNRRY
jgi:hypothetical protein